MRDPKQQSQPPDITVREDPSAAGNVTPLPGGPAGTEATVIEAPEPANPVAVPLAAGLEIDGWWLREAIKVTSGEADLWLAAGKQEGQTAVVKVFRWGLRPKAELAAKLSRVSRAQVVEVYGRGVLPDGRHYEILEHIRHGTLADLGNGAQAPDRVRDVLKELAQAVEALHEAGILHRDLKPLNVLVRTLEPLDLVLTDFGISSLAELSLHATSANRTAAYSAPEAMTGVVSRASDWWSVGVMVLELLRGAHPFAGLDERAINFQLVTRGIEVPAELPGDWGMLVKGLLTRDHAKRWGAEQVKLWQDGKRNMPLHYTAAAAAVVGQKPYRFLGQEYGDAARLAVALAEHWEEGVKHWGRGYVLQWVEKQLEDQDLAIQLNDVQNEKGLPTTELQLAAAVLVMNLELPLSYKGEMVTEEWVRAAWESARQVLDSQLPQWLRRLRGEAWLEESAQRRRKGLEFAERSGITFDRETAERLLSSGNREMVDGLAAERRGKFAKGRKENLTALLRKEQLEFSEAVLLATADPKEFFTAEQLLVHESLTWLDQQNVAYDRAKATQLVLARDWGKLTPLVRERRNAYSATRSGRLAGLLENKSIEYLDAVLLVCAKPNLFLDAQEHQCQQELDKIRRLGLPMCKDWETQATELLAQRDWSELPAKEDLEAMAYLSQSADLRAMASKPMDFWQAVALALEATQVPARLRFRYAGELLGSIPLLSLGIYTLAGGGYFLAMAFAIAVAGLLGNLLYRYYKLRSAGWIRFDFRLYPKARELVIGDTVVSFAEAPLEYKMASVNKFKMVLNENEYICKLDLAGGHGEVIGYLQRAGVVSGASLVADAQEYAGKKEGNRWRLGAIACIFLGFAFVLIGLVVSIVWVDRASGATGAHQYRPAWYGLSLAGSVWVLALLLTLIPWLRRKS